MTITKTNVTNMEDDQNQHDHLRQFVSDECKAQATEVSKYRMIYTLRPQIYCLVEIRLLLS